jgi:vitamin B12 transporter
MNRALTNTALAIAVSVSSSAYAQNLSTTTLDPILVTPNRISLTAYDTLAATTVLTREDIERLQPQDLPDLLGEVNGIHLTRSGGRGQPVSLFTRGTNSDHTLVLIDGMRLNEATNGSTNLQHIPLNQIDRIEVVRGPRASLYGADAIGGVIQIFTRQPQTSVRGSFGSNSLSNAGVGFGLSSEKSSLGIRANTLSSRGYDAKTTGDSDDDGYDEKSVAVSGRYDVSDSAAIDFKSMRSEGTVEFDNGSTDFRNQTAFVGLNHQMRRNRMLEVRLGQATDERETKDDDFGDSFNRTTRNEVTVKGTASSASYATSFGVDYYDDDVDTNGDYAETSRDNLGVFAQYQWFYGPWDLQVASRRDDNEAYGAENTGSAAIGRSFGSDHNAFLSYGTAFKAPSFNDLYNETRGPANHWLSLLHRCEKLNRRF